MRLFIAIDPSAEQKENVQALQRRLASLLDGVRWVRPEGLHLTLKFLGEQKESAVPSIITAVKQAAASTAPFNMRLGRTGVFPSPRRARIIWTGLLEGAADVKTLAASLEEALAMKGFPAENRPFKAHLTLGRARLPLPVGTVERLLSAESSFSTKPVPVRSLRLYESTLTPGGAIYRSLEDIIFMGK